MFRSRYISAILGTLLFMLISIALPAMPVSAGGHGPYPSGELLANPQAFYFLNNVEGATWHHIEITMANGVVESQWQSAETLECANEALYCIYETDTYFATAVGDNAGSWRTRAYVPGGPGDGITAWSSPVDFTILAPTVLDVTTTIPSSPNYWVERIEVATEYPDLFRMYVYNTSTGTTALDLWTPPISCGMSMEFETEYCVLYPYQQTNLSNGNYSVWIQAFTYEYGLSAWTEGYDFVINAPAPSVPDDIALGNIYEGTPFEATCASEGSTTECSSESLLFEVDYNDEVADWMEIVILDSTDTIIFSQWIRPPASPYCILDNICRFQVPIVFEHEESYSWRARIWNEYGGLSPYALPGGAGDPNDVGEFDVVISMILAA